MPTYDREKLYREIWAEPMSTVATRYGVSDVYLRRICKQMDIPLPGRGYWQRLAAGGEPKIPSLPESHMPTIDIEAETGPIQNPPAATPKSRRTKPQTPPEPLLEPPQQPELQPIVIENAHPLVLETLAEMEHIEPEEDGRFIYSPDYVLGMGVSPLNLERTLRFYNDLIHGLEEHGGRVYIDVLRGSTAVQIHGQIIYMRISESTLLYSRPNRRKSKSRQRSYLDESENVFTGGNELTFYIMHSVSGRTYWTDRKHKRLANYLGDIITAIFKAAHDMKMKAQQELTDKIPQIEAQIKHDEEIRTLFMLENIAKEWQHSQVLRQFVEAIDAHYANQTLTETGRKRLDYFVNWARERCKWMDPLTTQGEYDIDSKSVFTFVDYFEKMLDESPPKQS